MKFAIIDFEAANAQKGSICAVGVAVVEGFQIVETFYSLVNPKANFDPMCVRIHHIKPEDVSDAPTFSQLWDEKLSEMLCDLPLVAYNASYDIYHLEKALYDANIATSHFRYTCAMRLTKKWVTLSSYKLSKVAEHFQIHFNHHNALEDVTATACILTHIASEHNASDLNELMRRSCMTYDYTDLNNYDPATDKAGGDSYFQDVFSIYDSSDTYFNGRCVYIGNAFITASASVIKQAIDQRGGRVSSKLSSKVDTILIGFNRLERLENADVLSQKGQEAVRFAQNNEQVALLDENQFFERLGRIV